MLGAAQAQPGRTLAVATLHGKERVIGPALAGTLGITSWSVAPIDTDRFGAFSGEITRELDPRSAAEAKARAALAELGGDLAIASEGSFVPHPASPLLTLDEEWLVLVDAASGRVHCHRHATLEAVFSGRRCRSLEEVREFAAAQPFPGHSLVVRPRERWSRGDPVLKGLAGWPELERVAGDVLAAHGELWVETDLRAHHNPTRMRAIAAAARAFAAELALACPRCGAAHFRVTGSIPGLPCQACGEPTELARALMRDCEICGASLECARPDGRAAADPAQCPACNP